MAAGAADAALFMRGVFARRENGRPVRSVFEGTELITIFKTFDRWPYTQTAERKRRPFQAGYKETLQLLDRELLRLKAEVIVIQLNLDPNEIRLDGMPRVGARPTHPGVILSFESKFGPLLYPCDDCVEWTDNLRAIALTIERLRKAELYGVAKRGEQYKGWAQLPGPGHQLAAPTFVTKRDAAFWIAERSGYPEIAELTRTADPSFPASYISRVILAAAIKRCHPDSGGNDDLFNQLQTAREMLGL